MSDAADLLQAVKDLRGAGRHEDAAVVLERLLALAPTSAALWTMMVDTAARYGGVREVVMRALDAVARLPAPGDSLHTLSRWLRNNGYWEDSNALSEAILARDPDHPGTLHDYLSCMQISDFDDARCCEILAAWNDRTIRPILREASPARTEPVPGRPLRLGFVSNDFSADHSLNIAMAPWFGGREGGVSDTYVLYANLNTRHPPHAHFRDAADSFIEVEAQSDEALAAQIRADGIDILIDFVGHMDNSRLAAYARRPAPLVVHWIGIGLATGAESVDYLLSDPYRTPMPTQPLYVERLALLPQSGVAWAWPEPSPDVASPPHRSGRPFAFGNFSRITKFRDGTIRLWAQVMAAVPASIMVFKDHRLTPWNVERLVSIFESAGIGRDRLRFLPGTDRFRHLAAYGEIDVLLDSFPEHSGISALEAIWMGVPVVSLRRMARASDTASDWILHNLALPAFVTTTPEAYVDTASRLAGRSDVLNVLRFSLRARLKASAICDHVGFRRNARTALQVMWERYCAGLPPQAFSLER